MKTAAPEKKSVKTLKGQLFGAVSMMLVAAIALGTSTYAWFINNRTVEVENMQLTVSTSTSMLVAIGKNTSIAATGIPTAWTGYKSIVTNGDITGVGSPTPADPADWAQFFAQDMVPASVTDASLLLPTPTFYATNNHVSNGLLDEFLSVPTIDKTVETTTTYGVGQGPVKKLSLRFLSSNDIDVYFGKDAISDTIASLITPKYTLTPAQVDAMGEGVPKEAAKLVLAAEEKQADAIRAAIRVSVVAKTTGIQADGTAADTTTYTTSSVNTFQFDDGEGFGAAPKNNTDYNSQNSVSISENDGIYAAIASIDSDKHVLTTSTLTALVPDHSNKTKNANNVLALVKDSVVTPVENDNIRLFGLTKDIARDVDVYIWLEGTDQDCLNGISGYNFNLRLPFAGADHDTKFDPPAP